MAKPYTWRANPIRTFQFGLILGLIPTITIVIVLLFFVQVPACSN